MTEFQQLEGTPETTDKKSLIKEALFKVIFPAVLVIFTANMVFRSSDEDSPTEIIKKAEASGNYWIARQQYEKLIQEDFFNLKYHRGYLGSCLNISDHSEHNGRETEAREEYINYSLDNDVNVSDIGYYGLGYSYAICRDYNNALVNYNKVRNSNLPFLNNSIGHVYLKLKDTKKAKEYFLKEIEVGSNIEGAYSNLSEALYKEKDFDKLKELISDEKIKEYIPKRIIRIVNLRNGQVLKYISDFFNYDYVKSYGFLAAILILITWFRYLRNIDVFEPEKLYWLLITLIGGMFFAGLCSALYDFWDYGLHFQLNGHIINDLLYCIFGIGLIEESVKIIPFLLVLRFSRQINESIDYVIYASVSALGFAFMENLIYFQEPGIQAITGRALVSVLLHISLSTLAVFGLFYSKYKRNGQRALLYFAGGFTAAVVLHGLFDFGLIAEGLPSKAAIFSILILAITVNKFGIITKNALNISEFNTEQKTRVESLTRYLVYSISVIILLQYVLMAWKFGAKNANLSMLRSIFLYYFLILIIIGNLGRIEITKSKWTGLFERGQRLHKMEEAARQRAAEQRIDFDDLKKRYDKWEIALRFLFLFFSFASAGAFAFLFSWIASVRHNRQLCEHLILPPFPVWFLPSFFLGIVFSAIPVNFIFEGLLGKQRCKELELYTKLRQGKSHGKKTFLVMVALIIGANCIVLPFLFDYYVEVKNNEMVVNKFIGFSEISYPYEKIAELRLIKSKKTKRGGISRRRHYEIVFSDEYVFSFEQGNFDLGRDKEAEIMNFIAKRCGKEIQIVDPYPMRKR